MTQYVHLIYLGITLVTTLISMLSVYWLLRERIVKLEVNQTVMQGELLKGDKTMNKLNDSVTILNGTLIELKTIINERK